MKKYSKKELQNISDENLLNIEKKIDLKGYSKQELQNMSVEELQRISDTLDTTSTQPTIERTQQKKSTKPKPPKLKPKRSGRVIPASERNGRGCGEVM